MGTIAQNITRIKGAKTSLATSIAAKGVTVPTATTIDGYAALVDQIETGGGGENRLNLLLTKQITAVTLNDFSGVTTIPVSAFNGHMTNLKSVTMPNTITTLGDFAFFKCRALSALTFSTGITSIPNYCFLDDYYIPNIDLSNITSFGSECFSGCISLTAITASPTTMEAIGAFVNCTGLTSFTCLKNMGGKMGYGYSWSTPFFKNCTSLISIDFSHNYTIPTLGYAGELNSINPNYEIKVPQVLYNSWTGATNWSDASVVNHIVSVPNAYATPRITYTTNDESIVVPSVAFSAVSEWNASLIDNTVYGSIDFYGPLLIPNKAFQDNSKLLSVNIPEGVIEIIGNGYSSTEGAFYNCSNLQTVVLPNSLVKIGENAFKTCPSLTSVTFGSGLTTISTGAFDACSGLTSVILPNTVTNIDSFAFINCTGLQSITIHATTPPSAGSIWATVSSESFRIYVPAESVETYKTAQGFEAYSNYIEAIPE